MTWTCNSTVTPLFLGLLYTAANYQVNGRKGKEEYLYSAIYYACIVSKRSDMDHTVLPANYTMPAFPS